MSGDGVVLRTARLALRPFRADDAEALQAVLGDEQVMRFDTRGVRSPEQIDAWLARREAERREHPDAALWAVVDRDGGALLGVCGLIRMADVNGRPEVELAYRLARAAQGRGLATEAARAVRDHAFDALGVARLIAIIDPANTPSARVAEKLGMRPGGELLLEGYDHPDVVWAMERARRPPRG